jgi:hypothetical protein
MEEFIRRENLKLFQKQLALAEDEGRRQLLLRLIAEQEIKPRSRPDS